VGPGPSQPGELGGPGAPALNPENRVTFVIDRNINYTNICISGCRFCAFYRGRATRRVRPGVGRAGGEAHGTQGKGSRGLPPGRAHPRVAPEYYLELVRLSFRGFGLAVHAFSPPEIFYLADKTT